MTGKLTLLIDADSLGVERYLGNLDVKIIKVGSIDELPRGTSDTKVAQYAYNHKCVVVTRDDKLVRQCKFYDVKVITLSIEDLAKKVIQFIDK